MRHQVLGLLAAVGFAAAQGVTDKVAPPAPPPEGCKPNVDGKFEIAVLEIGSTQKRDTILQKRAACSGDGILVAELSDGVITDALNRTGYIASNFQFQFDKPPQAGAIYTAGFSHCNNGSLALGGSAVFYQCRSGSFSNLYDRWWAMQCSPVEILVMPCGGDNDEGQHVVGTSAMTTTVTVPLSDGHTKVITTTQLVPICQIDDGQIQGHTTPCTSAASIIPTPAISIPPVSQYSDGQIQVTPVATGEASTSIPVVTGPLGGTTLDTSVIPRPTSAPPENGAGRVSNTLGTALLVGLGLGVAWIL